MSNISIKGKEVTIYNWFDIRTEICDIMEIDEKYFRDYHKFPGGPGGEYKDLWHLALDSFIPDNMHNDSIVKLYTIESIHEYVNHYEPWTLPFFTAYNTIMQVLDPDNNGIYVDFSW